MYKLKEDLSIENMIYEIRGKQVMLDCDLAKLYNVETKRINEAVKNNPDKFPERFYFRINENEFFYFTGDFGLIKEKVTEITDRIIRRTVGTTLADFFAVSVCPVSFGLLPFQY